MTYRNSTDNGDLPVFLHTVSRLSDSDRDGWLLILSIGLIILQHVCVMFGPVSSHIFILNPLKSEYEKHLINLHTYIHTLIIIPHLLYMHACVFHANIYVLVASTLHVTQVNILKETAVQL